MFTDFHSESNDQIENQKVGFVPLGIKILLSDLTIFGAENRAEMTILGADFME